MNIKRLRDDILLSCRANTVKCMKCGKCSASCPSYDIMEYHPHQFVSMINSGDIHDFELILNSDSAYNCISCMACSERCPRGVMPSALIESVRLAKLRPKGQNHLLADSIPDKLDDDMPSQVLVTAFRKYSR